MADLKTKQTEASVDEFLNAIPDEGRRKDCFSLLELMKQVTQTEPKLWSSSIVGFGNEHYKYESGREGDWFLVGFSPRKQNLTLYLSNSMAQSEDLLQKLGKHKAGKGCIYINKLSDVDMDTLRELVEQSVKRAG